MFWGYICFKNKFFWIDNRLKDFCLKKLFKEDFLKWNPLKWVLLKWFCSTLMLPFAQTSSRVAEINNTVIPRI
jgi:hypothetical protein